MKLDVNDMSLYVPTSFENDINKGIEEKSLNVHQRMLMMKAIADSLMNNGIFYLCDDQLSTVTNFVFKKWPFLLQYSLGGSDYFLEGIKHNMRMSKPPPIRSEIVKENDKECDDSKHRKYLPGDDKHSIRKFITYMQGCCERDATFLPQLLPLMKSTFFKRREFILNDKPTAESIVKEYPVLASAVGVSVPNNVKKHIDMSTYSVVQIIHEMDCIFKVELKMIEKWDNCVQKIISMGKERNLKIIERIPSAGKLGIYLNHTVSPFLFLHTRLCKHSSICNSLLFNS